MMNDTDDLIRRMLIILAEDCAPDKETSQRLYKRIFVKEGEQDNERD